MDYQDPGLSLLVTLLPTQMMLGWIMMFEVFQIVFQIISLIKHVSDHL